MPQARTDAGPSRKGTVCRRHILQCHATGGPDARRRSPLCVAKAPEILEKAVDNYYG